MPRPCSFALVSDQVGTQDMLDQSIAWVIGFLQNQADRYYRVIYRVGYQVTKC